MENITENNKIIAEFMGAKLTKDLKIMYPVYEGDSSYVKNLKYHSDWSWLMEVVEKIETISVFGKLPEFFIMYDNREEFKGWYWLIEVPKKFSKECYNDKNREKTKIEAVYNACAEFIKWYNENKSK